MPVFPETQVVVANEDGSIANFPQTTGRTPIFQPSVVPPGYLFYGTGAFDDPLGAAGNQRGSGLLIRLKTGGAPSDVATVSGQFVDHVYILGGQISAKNGEYDDTLSLLLVAPASTPDAQASGNAKWDPSPWPGVNKLVPVQGNTGTHNVDGAALVAGELNAKLVPVPAFNGDTPIGHWDWDPDQNPSITPNYEMKGAYNMYSVTLPLARQANKYDILSNVQPVVPEGSVQGKKILPHWIWSFTLTRGFSVGAAECAIRLHTARKSTT